MGLMDGKNVVIFGVANNNSIAWGITQTFHQEGANIGLSYAGEVLKRRVAPLADSIGVTFGEEGDRMKDDALDTVFAKAKERFGTLDTVVHAVAFATREDMEGEFFNTSRQGFNLAMNISVYSLIARANRAKSLMPNDGSIITLSYFGAAQVMPHYSAMGLPLGALEVAEQEIRAKIMRPYEFVGTSRPQLRHSAHPHKHAHQTV